jgi:sulfur carrier protein ThiS adenylyltransferase
MIIVAIVGRSGAGKTTFIRELIREFRRRKRVIAVVKHCGDGFDMRGEDKDSSVFLAAGAETAILSGPRSFAVLRKQRRRRRDRDLAGADPSAEIVLIEGGRVDSGIPTIEVVGPKSTDRVPIAEGDRWIVVSRAPIQSPKPVFPPAAIREIADLIETKVLSTAGPADELRKISFFARHDAELLAVLRKSVVGIAGAGGLGSNVAIALARAGLGKLLIADFDRIEPSNLNRQQYFGDQVSRVKVEALAENIRRIHPYTAMVVHRLRVTAQNTGRLFGEADVLVEAFDRADQKQLLIEAWMTRFPERPIIAASGLAGFGANNRIRERRIGKLTLIGDESSEVRPEISPLAPRVAIVAAMQANRVVECLFQMRRSICSR